MKKTYFILLAVAILMISCNRPSTNEHLAGMDTFAKDSLIVNKQYDSAGALVLHDHAYSDYYAATDSDLILKDSIYRNFLSTFNKLYFFSDQPYFNHLFFVDSLLKYDFYRKDFFTNRYKNNTMKMDKLFHEMDSVKNKYFEDEYQKLKNAGKNEK